MLKPRRCRGVGTFQLFTMPRIKYTTGSKAPRRYPVTLAARGALPTTSGGAAADAEAAAGKPHRYGPGAVVDMSAGAAAAGPMAVTDHGATALKRWLENVLNVYYTNNPPDDPYPENVRLIFRAVPDGNRYYSFVTRNYDPLVNVEVTADTIQKAHDAYVNDRYTRIANVPYLPTRILPRTNYVLAGNGEEEPYRENRFERKSAATLYQWKTQGHNRPMKLAFVHDSTRMSKVDEKMLSEEYLSHIPLYINNTSCEFLQLAKRRVRFGKNQYEVDGYYDIFEIVAKFKPTRIAAEQSVSRAREAGRPPSLTALAARAADPDDPRLAEMARYKLGRDAAAACIDVSA